MPGHIIGRRLVDEGHVRVNFAIVAAGATVEDSVVMAGARISAGAVVRSSLVGARSVVGEACELTDLTDAGIIVDRAIAKQEGTGE